MAHEWDSYFPNFPPLSSDQGTSRRTSDSEGSLSQHIENLIEQHDFSSAVDSTDTPATNSNFDTNYYSNSNVGNSSSDCLYERYYSETSWQADGVAISKDQLPRDGDSEIPDFAKNGMSSSESFPSSFSKDIHEFKQDSVLSQSFLEEYSDVTSCSDEDVNETRPACKYSKNSAPEPIKADATEKQTPSEWLFTRTGAEIDAFLPSLPNIKASEDTVEFMQDKMESPENLIMPNTEESLSIPPIAETKTGDESNVHQGHQGKGQNEDMEKEQKIYSAISTSGLENLTGDDMEKDSGDDEVGTAPGPNVTKCDNKKYDLNRKGPEDEMKASCQPVNECSGNADSEDPQERNMSSDKLHDSDVLKNEGHKESSSLENGTFDEPKKLNPEPESTVCQDKNVKLEYQDTLMTIECQEKGTLPHAAQRTNSNFSSRADSKGPGHSGDTSGNNQAKLANDLEFCLQQSTSVANVNSSLKPKSPNRDTSAHDSDSSQLSGISDSLKNSSNEQSVDSTCTHTVAKQNISSKHSDNSALTDSPSADMCDMDSSGACLPPDNSSMDGHACVKEDLIESPAGKSTATSSSDMQLSPQQSPVAQEPEGLNGFVTDNAGAAFEEFAPVTDDQSVPGLLYGEPLSREDSCDTDEFKPDASRDGELYVSSTSLNSSLQGKKYMHPVVVIKRAESANAMTNSYQCAICQYSTESVDVLIDHHLCSHSGHNFQLEQTCNVRLMRNEHKDKNFTCETPQLSQGPFKRKRKHYKNHMCKKCRLTFPKYVLYVKHMRTHTGKTPYQCNGCGTYFAQNCSLQRHQRVPGRCKRPVLASPATKTSRIVSKEKAPSQKELVQSNQPIKMRECFVKLVDIFKGNVCTVCGKGFPSSEKFKKHFNNVHKGKCFVPLPTSSEKPTASSSKAENEDSETESKYKCPLCPRIFKYSYNRSRHLRDCVRNRISDDKGKHGRYTCPLCQSTFTSAANRYRHIKTSCLKEFITQLMKKRRSARKVELKNVETEHELQAKEVEQRKLPKESEVKHSQVPMTLPRYKCKLCPAVFWHASGKYRHMKKHKIFDLTGKTVKYRNTVHSTVSKLKAASSSKFEAIKDNLKANEKEERFSVTCQFCDKNFETELLLKHHQRTHRGERPYCCLECGKSFKKRAYLVGHRVVHRKRMECTVCKKTFVTAGQLAEHSSSHKEKGNLQDPNSPLQFKKRKELLGDINSHKHGGKETSLLEEEHLLKSATVKGEPQCALCKEVFKDSNSLRRHSLKHISKSSSCPFCGQNYSCRRYLLRHMIKHTGKKPFSCNYCGKQFYTDLNLKLHHENCLPNQIVQIYKRDVNGHYHCSICPRTFSKKNRLKCHHHAHKLKSLLLCSTCGQYFGFTQLKQHQRICTGIPQGKTDSPSTKNTDVTDAITSTNQQSLNKAKVTPQSKILHYKCSHCTHKFRYKSLLLRHLVTHTGLQPYPCMYCGHRYRSLTACLQHEVFCHRSKEPLSADKGSSANELSSIPSLREAASNVSEAQAEFKCKFCTKTFMKSQNLRHHILTHNEVKPYRCKACDSCFSRYDHLKVHQARCKGKRSQLKVCIPKITLDDVGKGWQNRFLSAPVQKLETFQCETCSRIFPTQSKLSRHFTMFHAVKLFKCSRCDSEFAHEKSLKKHKKMKKCRKAPNETINSPPPETALSENLAKPLLMAKTNVLHRILPTFNKKYKFVCSFCPRAFGTAWQLSVHTRLHTGERPYSCSYCGERFIRKDYVQRHFPKCPGKKQQNDVLCDICGSLVSEIAMKNHKKLCIPTPIISKATMSQILNPASQMQTKGFSCAYCSSRFFLFSQLQEHFLNAHKLETMDAPATTAPLQQHLSNIPVIKEEPLDDVYDQQPSDGTNLINKVDTQPEPPSPWVCSECKLSFASKAGLVGHQRVHSTEHLFKCKTCKKGFWNKNLLRNHYRKCRPGHVSANNCTKRLAVPLKAEIDFALTDSVLVFKDGSKRTGTGVLQTNFSCKDDLTDESPQNTKGSEEQTSLVTEKKVVQYQCSECEMSFTDGLMLISHLEDHGREEQRKRSNTCATCGRLCTSPASLEKHMRMHASDKTYSCPDCPKTVHSLSDLEAHRSCHDPSRPYSCIVCKYRFWTKQSLCSHYNETHPNNVFTCRFCNKTYTSQKSLSRHYKEHHVKEMQPLDRSAQDKSSSEQQSISQVNVTRSSDEDENDSEDSDSAPYFPCHVCAKTFSTSESLEDHQRCHLGEKPHECAECGKCFFHASQLEHHQRMHKSEFQCQVCRRGFVSLFALRKHKHTHGKSRTFQCSKCQLFFTGPSQLAEHMSTHREESFPCDICSHVFRSKSMRAEHRKSHSMSGGCTPPLASSKEHEKSGPPSQFLPLQIKKKKYRCGVCHARFSNPEMLSEHGCIAAKERPYSCSDCDKHFLHTSHLKKHRKTHETSWSNSQYPCNKCNNSYSSFERFLSHLTNHDDATAKEADAQCEAGESSNGFQCPVCHQDFANADGLIGHFPTHAGKTFECERCRKNFPSRRELEAHEQCHLQQADPVFKCTSCGQKFLERDYQTHLCPGQQCTVMETDRSNPLVNTVQNSKQAAGEDEDVDVIGEDFHSCSFCFGLFSSKIALLEHQNKDHQNDRPFNCNFCEKNFTTRRNLRKHERRHEKKRDFNKSQESETTHKCSHCSMEYSTAQRLSLHMRMHAEKEVGVYRCDMCYKSFNHLSFLKQHQESHVGEVVYECTECDKAFAFPHLLEEHQQTHALAPK